MLLFFSLMKGAIVASIQKKVTAAVLLIVVTHYTRKYLKQWVKS